MSVELLTDGLHFGEGPRWHQGKLWFSDFFDHAVKTVDLAGTVETKLSVAGRPSGLGWLPDGRMLIVSMTDRLLLRLESDALVVHADLSDIATFHCNDMSSTGLAARTSATSDSTSTQLRPPATSLARSPPTRAPRLRVSTPTAQSTRQSLGCGSPTAASSPRTAAR